MNMPRYEYKKGSSQKFWEIEISGSGYKTCYGKIGTDGRAGAKSFDSAEKAQKEADKQIKSKLKKGYALVEEGAEARESLESIDGLQVENIDTWSHAKKFVFRTVLDFKAKLGLSQAARGNAYRIRTDYDDADDGYMKLLDAMMADKRVGALQALVFGAWADMYDGGSEIFLGKVLDNADKFESLEAIYLGDVIQEENEISWTNWADWSRLMSFPKLQHLRNRGGTAELSPMESESLRSLAIQSGGLSANAISAIGQSSFPNLEHLELWLGTPNYGGIGSPEVLAPILSGKKFPKLRYLGLRNSQIADEIAALVATSPIINRIETLDLSMGVISDEGAQALLASPAIKKLKSLFVQHNFFTDKVRGKLYDLGIECNASRMGADQDDADDPGSRYVSVSE
jgi:predicted DNA-binding WGR domain protein